MILCICCNIREKDVTRYCYIGSDCGKCLELQENRERLKESKKVPTRLIQAKEVTND